MQEDSNLDAKRALDILSALEKDQEQEEGSRPAGERFYGLHLSYDA